MTIFGNIPMRIQQGYGIENTHKDALALYESWGWLGHNAWDVVPRPFKFNVAIYWPFEGWEVLYIKTDKPNGNHVVLWEPKKYLSVWMCHMSKYTEEIHPGDLVELNQYLGNMGHTGICVGYPPDHVHLQLNQCDKYANRENRKNGYNGGINPELLFGKI